MLLAKLSKVCKIRSQQFMIWCTWSPSRIDTDCGYQRIMDRRQDIHSNKGLLSVWCWKFLLTKSSFRVMLWVASPSTIPLAGRLRTSTSFNWIRPTVIRASDTTFKEWVHSPWRRNFSSTWPLSWHYSWCWY